MPGPGTTNQDIRQSILRSTPSMIGNAANTGVDTLLSNIDGEMGKLFEDRNILLTDGGTITFTGTQVQFTDNLKITVNQKISGAVPQVISLGSSSQNFTNSGDMLVAVLNRTAGTATLSIVTNGSALSAAVNANQEVFLIAKRVDAADGTQRLYWRNGFAQNAGQTLRLGQGGGSGTSGSGSDLDTLQFRAVFIEPFTEGPTNSVSAVNANTGFTNASYNAAKQMYTINYDASRTITANTSVTMHISGGSGPAFTVAAGDVVINLVTGEVRKITVIGSINSDGGAGTPFTIESAFASNPSAVACCVSQCVHTVDIYNYNANSTAAAISASFGSTAFSEIMVDYEDNAASGSNLWTPDVAPFCAYVGSTDNTNWMTLQTRTTNTTDQMQSDVAPTSGTSLYLRFFSARSSGTGFVNLLNYEAFMQKALGSASGATLWSAYGVTNSSTSPINCTLSVVGGKTQIALTGGLQYPIGVNSGNAYGILDVYVNGQMLPRYVAGSVPTSDGYYTEVSSTIIQLDKDYSSLALDFMIVYRVQVVDVSSQNSTAITQLQTNGLKNYLINGAFDLWQRQTSATIANGSSSYVAADRWYVKNGLGTSGVITMSQVTGTLPGSKYGCSVQITTAPTASQANVTELYQVIENPMSIDLINQSISASMYVKALGNVNQVGIQFAYATSEIKPTLFFGTEQLVTVNSSGFTLASLLNQNSGNTPTASGVIGIRVRITGVSSGNLYALNNGFVVEQAEVNIGATAMTFARAGRYFGEEVALCQRYYEKSYDIGTAPGTVVDTASWWSIGTNVTGGLLVSVGFKAEKRASPTVTGINPVSGGASWETSTNSASIASSILTVGLGSVTIGTSVTPAAQTAYKIHWTADAEI